MTFYVGERFVLYISFKMWALPLFCDFEDESVWTVMFLFFSLDYWRTQT
jgi:hypothetical protein